MGFSDFARDARKNAPAQRTPSIAQNDISDALMENSKPAPEKKDVSYRDSDISGFVPQQRSFGARQTNDPKHGSIIRNIASQSNSSSQMGGNATWEECKHRKQNSGKDYCSEFHSLCAKNGCRRATR